MRRILNVIPALVLCSCTAGVFGAVPVTFRYTAPEAATVHLRGTFNNWTPGVDVLEDPDADDVWTLTKPFEPDVYEYKFFVDDAVWVTDPLNPDTIGGFNNSLLTVESPMLYYAAPFDNAIFPVNSTPFIRADVSWDDATTLSQITLTLNGAAVADSMSFLDTVTRRFEWEPATPLTPGLYAWELSAETADGGVAIESGSFLLRAQAAEVYYDQFDFGFETGNPGALNLDFWAGGPRLNYLPELQLPSAEGAVRLGNGGDGFSALYTNSLNTMLAGNSYEVFARVRLSEFESGSGEKNFEIATRSNGTQGYLFTLDAGNDQIRLRRQGGGFVDLIPPVNYDFAEDDIIYIHQTVSGSDPVTIDLRLATDSSFSGPALIYDESVEDTDWLPNGNTVGLIGFSDDGDYNFDVDYFAIGELGYVPPADHWNRPLYTNAPPEPERTVIGDMDSYTVTDTGVEFLSGDMKLVVTPRLEGTVRVDVVPPGSSVTEDSFAVTRTEWPSVPFTVTDGDPVIISGGNWSVEATRTPLRLSFIGPEGEVLLSESPDHPAGAADEARFQTFVMNPDDRIYGLGQPSFYQDVGINRRGHSFTLRNDHEPPSVLLFPVWVSPLNYGVFVDNPSFASLSFGDADPDLIRYNAENGELTYYVMVGESMYDITDQYTQITGRPALAPRWTLGNIQSKFGYQSFAEINNIIDEFDNRDIPLDGIIIDLYWFGIETMGNLDFQQTPEWANPAQELAALRSRGIRTIPITEPQVTGLSFNAAEVLAQNLVGTLPGTSDPYPITLNWITTQAFIYLLDFTNPDTIEWWKDKHEKLIVEYGFDGFWQDLNEPEGMPNDIEYAAGPAEFAGNVQAIGMNRALSEAMDEYRPGARPFIMSRSGSPGMQKYGTSVWSGDVPTNFESLTDQVQLAQSMGLAGVPYWNSDIGGFNGTPSPELYLRWCQFGIFNPVYRPHGAQSDREPWRFGSDVEDAVRELLRLRYALVPYYYSVARESYDTGAPIMRPLVMDWPDDPAVADLESQFMYGPDLLVRPVTQQGATNVDVYLPEGAWTNWFTGETLSGPQTTTLPAGLVDFPLFVRTPAILPLAEPRNRTDAAPLDPLVLRVFWTPRDAVASGELYEDDGLSTAYQTGGFARTHFTAMRTGAGAEVVISESAGTFDGKLPERAFSLSVPLETAPVTVTVNGTPLNRLADSATAPESAGWSWSPSTGEALVRTPSLPTDAAHTVEVRDLPPADLWMIR